MSFLLDTNVVSEWAKSRPNPNVVAWLSAVDEDHVYMSVASFAEIRHGVERMPDGKRRERLATWLADKLPARFERRILGIDRRVAEIWGIVMARGQKAGFTPGTMDAFFVATAETHGLTLATRNIRDFAKLGVPLFDPWNLRP